jgi:predicted lipid-binding transport protein (Tim44 family)
VKLALLAGCLATLDGGHPIFRLPVFLLNLLQPLLRSAFQSAAFETRPLDRSAPVASAAQPGPAARATEGTPTSHKAIAAEAEAGGGAPGATLALAIRNEGLLDAQATLADANPMAVCQAYYRQVIERGAGGKGMRTRYKNE